QEFHVTRNLDHPNLVRPLRLGRADGVPYLVMELVEGQSLGERIEASGRLPEADAVRIITEVAGVLEAAHRQRVLHRDIKPDNILLTAGGTAKLTDLGLAKDAEAAFDLTRPMTGLGTPNFMAPEQFRDARHADARCDVYRLSTWTWMRIMKHDPHPTRRYDSCRSPGVAPGSAAGQGARPPGDRPALRRRLVAAAHRPAPGLPPAHQPRRPQGLPRPRPAGPLARAAGARAGRAAAAGGRRGPAPLAGPGAHLDQPPAQRRPDR